MATKIAHVVILVIHVVHLQLLTVDFTAIIPLYLLNTNSKALVLAYWVLGSPRFPAAMGIWPLVCIS